MPITGATGTGDRINLCPADYLAEAELAVTLLMNVPTCHDSDYILSQKSRPLLEDETN